VPPGVTDDDQTIALSHLHILPPSDRILKIMTTLADPATPL